MKRSPMPQRSAPLRRTAGEARLTVPVFRPKGCKVCKTKFTPTRRIQPVCAEVACAITYAEGLLAAKKARAVLDQRRAAKEDRQETRARKTAIKTRSEWIQEAEKAVRAVRRLEELAKGRGCMSCLRSQDEVNGAEGWRPGGAWDAGHFLGKGACPELRMEPKNIWLQCKSCNAGSAKYARKGFTVNQAFETNLRAAEGDALVDWLKGPHAAAKHTVEQLQAIKATFGAKARELKKAAA